MPVSHKVFHIFLSLLNYCLSSILQGWCIESTMTLLSKREKKKQMLAYDLDFPLLMRHESLQKRESNRRW